MLCLTLGQELSTIRLAPANHLGGVATNPIAEPFDHRVERIGHRGVHGRYPRKLADGKHNAFGKFRLHKLRELAHNVAVVIELDSADLDNLIAPVSRRWRCLGTGANSKSSTIWRAKFVVSIAEIHGVFSADTVRAFLRCLPLGYISGYIAVRIAPKA